MESKIKARRISANFSQILAEAKLNRSMTSSPSNLFSEVYADSPKRQVVKQARISDSGSKSFAISTVIEKTPKVNVNKRQSQKKPASVLKAFSANRQMNDTNNDLTTPTRRIKETPTYRLKQTPQVSSVLRAVHNNSTFQVLGEEIKVDPMQGPVQLNSIGDLKWAQQLVPIGDITSAVMRVPAWNPLPENYFDHHGPTAELKKSESHRKAGKKDILIETIKLMFVFRERSCPNNQQIRG